jgi:hypothetical protein
MPLIDEAMGAVPLLPATHNKACNGPGQGLHKSAPQPCAGRPTPHRDSLHSPRNQRRAAPFPTGL